MELVVFGATGGTGMEVVEQAVAAGHDVTAVVRNHARLPVRAGLSVVEASIEPGRLDAALLADAVRGRDAVVSALGASKRGPAHVCTDGATAVVAAMHHTGVRRLVAVSAHGARESRDRSLYSLLLWAAVREKMLDKERMEAVVESSGLDWTIVRPPALTRGAATGRYRVGDTLPIRPWSSISRADLAAYLIAEAERPAAARFPRIAR